MRNHDALGKDGSAHVPQQETNRTRAPQEEHIRIQQTITYGHDEIVLVITEAQTCYVNLTQCCKALGLNARGQLQRIQRTAALSEGLRQLPLETRGGTQRINCLRLDLLKVWLTSMKGKVLTGELWEQIETLIAVLLEAEHTLRSPEAYAGIPRNVIIEADAIPAPPPNKETLGQEQKPQENDSQEEESLALPEEVYSSLLDDDAEMPTVMQQSWLDEEVPKEPQAQRTLLTTLPGVNSAPILVTTGYQEDRAIREATLARQADWQEEPVSQRMRYIASNKLHVYLGDPEYPLSGHETSTVLRALGESTVLTARILLGLWNIRRDDHQLTKDGSAAIRIDDILEWRGVQKHHRAVYPGAQKQSTDGYQWKHKQQVHRDIKLLELCHLRGYHTIMIKGKTRQFSIDGPYLRVTSVKETISETKEDIIGYFIAPGAWINTYEEHASVQLIELDRRIFQLHPQNDQIALRIALYITEQWKLNARAYHSMDPITMADLLTASMVPIDRTNLTARFIPRVEAAIRKLYTQGIVGRVECLDPLDRTQVRWGKEWLRGRWVFHPPTDLLEHRSSDQRQAQLPLLLDEPEKP